MLFVLAVPVHPRVIGGEGAGKVAELRADALAAQLSAQARKKISAGAGATSTESRNPYGSGTEPGALQAMCAGVGFMTLLFIYLLARGPQRTPPSTPTTEQVPTSDASARVLPSPPR